MGTTRSVGGVGGALILLALALRYGADLLPPSGAPLSAWLDAGATVALVVGAGAVAGAAFLAAFGWLRRAARR